MLVFGILLLCDRFVRLKLLLVFFVIFLQQRLGGKGAGVDRAAGSNLPVENVLLASPKENVLSASPKRFGPGSFLPEQNLHLASPN